MTAQAPIAKATGAVRLPALVLATVTLAAGTYDGWQKRRGPRTSARPDAAQRLANVPESFGDWQIESSPPLDAATQAMLSCTACVNRIYRHRITDDRLHVAVLAGPAGPISVHTPDVCYASQDYRTVAAPERVQIRPGPRPDETFWEATFRPVAADGSLLQVVYAWSAGDFWKAASQPRFAFGGEPLVYKLQATSVSAAGDAEANGVCREFLEEFLPLLDEALFAGSTASDW